MDRAGFWTIIDDARSGAQDDEAFIGRLAVRLRGLTPQELTQFQAQFEEVHTGSYAWEPWGAAYIVNGGCSDDGFEYFRAWLIAQGRRTFERVMADPDTLVEVSGEYELEELMSIAVTIYEEQTGGQTMPRARIPYPDLGEGWDFEDAEEMRRRYPRLIARYR